MATTETITCDSCGKVIAPENLRIASASVTLYADDASQDFDMAPSGGLDACSVSCGLTLITAWVDKTAREVARREQLEHRQSQGR